MVKRHMVTLHHVITVYNDMFNHLHDILQTLAKKTTQWKEDLYFTVKFAPQKQSKNCAEVTLTKSMILISAQILDPFLKLRLFRKWIKTRYINRDD